MKRYRQHFVGALVAATLLLGGHSALADVITSGSYDWSLADPTASSRLFRDGVASDWGLPHAFPGISSGGPFEYTTIAFNSGAYSYLQLTLNNLNVGGVGELNLTPALYTTALDPANLAAGAGWVGYGGISTGQPGVPIVFRVDATQFTNYLFFVQDTNGGAVGTAAGAFAYTIEGFTSPSAVPLPPGIWLLASGLAGLWLVRRRQSLIAAA